ncbi:hypothetical protein Tco_0282479 [Tanacetum coccineum]
MKAAEKCRRERKGLDVYRVTGDDSGKNLGIRDIFAMRAEIEEHFGTLRETRRAVAQQMTLVMAGERVLWIVCARMTSIVRGVTTVLLASTAYGTPLRLGARDGRARRLQKIHKGSMSGEREREIIPAMSERCDLFTSTRFLLFFVLYSDGIVF